MAVNVPGEASFGGYTGPLRCVAFSPDGATFAAGGDDRKVRLWDAATMQQTAQFTGHSDWVRAVCYSPDGTTVATAGNDTTVRLWDAATGQQTAQFAGHTGTVRAVCYSPDGATLATGGNDTTVRLWDTATGQQTGQLTGHSDTVLAIVYSTADSSIATGSNDNTVRLWDAATGQQTALLTGHARPVNAVSYSPGGTTLAAADDDAAVRLWDIATGRQIAQLIGHTRQVEAVCYSPDGTILATASGDATVRLWDAATGQQIAQFTGHTGTVLAVVHSPDGTGLVSVGSDGKIRIWDRSTGAVSGTGLESSHGRRSRPLAGVRSDSPSIQDLLGIADDVETLAELIAANETQPPLAIALIGDWGAGKSSVMLQVEQHIDVLAERARGNPGLSAFAENVRQVRFNAWHYSDDHVWAGLVSRLFEAIAAPPEQRTDACPPAQSPIPSQREKLRAELALKRLERDKLARALKEAENAPHPVRTRALLGSMWSMRKFLVTAGYRALRERGATLLALLGLAILGGALYLAWRFAAAWIAGVTTVVAVAGAPIALIARELRSGYRALVNLARSQCADLSTRHQQAELEICALRDQLVLIDAAARLERFMDERGGPASYREYQGLLGQVHADLKRLSSDLAQARAEWALCGGNHSPPLERIVLYIDDLDRCPPRRVVEVLEAVHLMLTLDLFVVVVAVDARWLIRSLEYHHHELFSAKAGTGGIYGLATPVDYLDKIFQIPYVLLPPAPRATAAYLRALMPRPAPAASAALTAADPNAIGSAAQAVDPAVQNANAPADWKRPGHRRVREHGAEIRNRVMGPGSPTAPAVELQPPGLQLSRSEVEFMTRLGGLVPTPRSAKRLVNIYRLVRIGVPDDELAAFVGNEKGGPYQAVQVLLAILIGHPDAARVIFRKLEETPDECDLGNIVERAGAEQGGVGSFAAIAKEIELMRAESAVSVSAAEYQRWCSALARFSFHTRDLVGRGQTTRLGLKLGTGKSHRRRHRRDAHAEPHSHPPARPPGRQTYVAGLRARDRGARAANLDVLRATHVIYDAIASGSESAIRREDYGMDGAPNRSSAHIRNRDLLAITARIFGDLFGWDGECLLQDVRRWP